MKKSIDIVINIDNEYLQHAMAMLCSLFFNNSKNHIKVHVLQKELSQQSKSELNRLTATYNNEIVYYDIDDSVLKGVQFRKNRPLSYAAYYRLLIAEVLPQEVSKVLYLDCDLIVLEDIAGLFDIEIHQYALAATLDTFPYTSQHRNQLHLSIDDKTFCSGVMLINLDFWRQKNVTSGLLEYAKRHREEVYLHDQDVLNYYFKGKWFILPPKWNRYATSNRANRFEDYKYFDYKEYTEQPVIMHYAAIGIKPWYNCKSPKYKIYRTYLYKSGYNNIKFLSISFIDKIKITLKYLKVELGYLKCKLLKRY